MRRLLVVLLVSVTLLSVGCSPHKRNVRTDAITDRAQIPLMDSRGVMTLVSDSGVTRYRIVAESWQKYDAADPPYQEFKEGIYLEQFAEDLSVKASLKADYAYYNERDERWRLDGNVVAVNREGERFETPQLLWDQQTELIRTDSVITITKKSSVITGVGMVSNQDMSEYTILNPTGYFPIDEQ